MNIETRDVFIPYEKRKDPDAYKEYEAFGWQYSQELHHGRSTSSLLVRDKNMPNYDRIAELDKEYFELKAKKKYYEKMSFGTFLLLLLIFIVPGLLYWLFKHLRKSSINDYNAKLQAQMDKRMQEAQSLLAKQN